MSIRDLTGVRFGNLTVTGRSPREGRASWECRCDCGRITHVQTSNLTCGNSTRCGLSCSFRAPQYIDLTGQRFGKVIALKFSHRTTRTYWICRCDCGVEKPLDISHLKSGTVKSCGCGRRTHEQTGTRLYATWNGMRARCRGEGAYVEKGITVCPEWDEDFQVFYDWATLNGYNETAEIDRINGKGNYEPSNCRFTTALVQTQNRSCTVWLTIDGETKTAKDWSDDPRSELTYTAIWKRIKQGWPRNIQILKNVPRLHAESWAYAESMGMI